MKNVSVSHSMLATTAGQSVLNNNAFGLSKQKDVGVYLHIERGSEIRSQVVTPDACGNALQCQV